MWLKTLIVLLVLVGAGGAAWRYRDAPAVRDLAGAAPRLQGQTSTTPGAKPGATRDRSNERPSTDGMRKCRKADGAVLYTDEPCPAGTRELKVEGGGVTVVPGYKPQPSAAPASAPDAQSIRDKRMEQIIGK